MNSLLVTLVLSGLLSASDSTPPTALVEVELSPPSLDLRGPYASAQLVVQGLRADGMSVDWTREATRVSVPEFVELDERGRVRPRHDGEGTIRLQVEDRELSVPVSVRGLGEAYEPSFRLDVMPVLSRAGCNAGTCHGAAQGKNGFRLSLRGYDPLFDWRALTDELAGRRFNRASPEHSLFLMKPVNEVPHEGGQLFERGSPEWSLLRDWIAGGVRDESPGTKVVGIELFPKDPTLPTPGDRQQFRVVASYGDGSQRDVTALSFLEPSDIERAAVDEHGMVTTLRRGACAVLARYEGAYASTRLFIMGDREGFEWSPPPEFNHVDTLVYQRLEEIKTLPSELCTDSEFLRRVRLDLTGRLPSVDEVRTFLMDDRPGRDKRAELVDRLVGSVEFVDHWTNKWCDLLQVNPKFLGEDGARGLRRWVRRQVVSNTPYDAFVHALLTGSGSTADNPPASYYKILRQPDLVMENTTQLFLGIRFNCNKCHDHPFERWTQSQHWQLAAYFSQVERKDAPGSERMPASTAMQAGEQPPAYVEIIRDGDQGELEAEGRTWSPGVPYDHAGSVPEQASRRQQLAAWLTAAENPYFARSYVNRVFSYFFGIGLIHPVDDIRAGNPPSHPALLDWLTEQFLARDMDTRWLMKTLCKSRVYQHSVRTHRWNEDDDVHLSHALARRLPAETLFDAVHQAAGSRPRLPGTRPGTRATQLVGNQEAGDGFLGLFGKPPRESACECERKSELSLGQALNLVNGPTLADAIRDPESDISLLPAYLSSNEAVVEELALRFFGRSPTAPERELARSLDPRRRENLSALSPGDRQRWDRRFQAWEAETKVARWEPLELGTLRSAGGATLEPQDDGSIRVLGASPDKDTYTVVGWVDAGGIRGVRIEALPDASLKAQGPGRAENGNFVLNEFLLAGVPTTAPTTASAAVFGTATADFSQNGWDVREVLSDPAKGWAVANQFGRPHEAWFELEQDLLPDSGGLLVFTLVQNHGSMHTLGRFRLSVSRSERPIRHSGLPAAVQEALLIAAAERTEAQHELVHQTFVERHPELARTLRTQAVQDLAWAMANSPAFLFNH